MLQLRPGAGSASTFVPVTYVMTQSSAQAAMCSNERDCAGLTQRTAGSQTFAGYWLSVYDHLYQSEIHPTALFLRVHTSPSPLFYPCLTPLSAGVLFQGGEFAPGIKEMLWTALLSSILDEHHGHAEVIPEMISPSKGDIGEKAGPNLFADLSQFNSPVPPAPREKNTPS